MTLEYKMNLNDETKIQPLVVFVLCFKRITIGIVCAILGLIFAALGTTINRTLLVLCILFLAVAVETLIFFLNICSKRNRNLVHIYRFCESNVLTYTLSENDGVIRNFCHERKAHEEAKRTQISRVISKKNFVFVVFSTGDVWTFPNTKEILAFWKQ